MRYDAIQYDAIALRIPYLISFPIISFSLEQWFLPCSLLLCSAFLCFFPRHLVPPFSPTEYQPLTHDYPGMYLTTHVYVYIWIYYIHSPLTTHHSSPIPYPLIPFSLSPHPLTTSLPYPHSRIFFTLPR